MCGIAGVATRKADPRSFACTERMVTAIAHRGPDSHGVQDVGHCVLGNTRLAIVDLSERGRQPMCNEDSTVWITYNGECYNADEFRPLLLGRGHRFRSVTDSMPPSGEISCDCPSFMSSSPGRLLSRRVASRHIRARQNCNRTNFVGQTRSCLSVLPDQR